MSSQRVIIISGSPGSGKSSVSRKLAEMSTHDMSVHMHTDDFYKYICKGHIEPWLLEAEAQNTVVIEAFATSVAKFAMGGYEVIVDGVIGPWFVEPWTRLVRDGFDVRYVILRADEHTTIYRATKRDKPTDLTDGNVVTEMWRAFCELGEYESHVIDTTNLSLEETIVEVRTKLKGDGMRI